MHRSVTKPPQTRKWKGGNRRRSETPEPSTHVAAPGAAAVLTLAPRARIVSASTDAGKLVLHVQTATGGEVEIIDLATGRLTAQVKTAP